MSEKISITLDKDLLQFVDSETNNRSSFINQLLREKQRKVLKRDLRKAYAEQANDPEFREEVEAWDTVVGDGIDA